MRLITNKSKNLFDYHKASKILGSATLSKQSDFILIATQTHKNEYTSVEVELDKSFVGKTVTLSALVKTSSINNPNLRIQWFKSDGLATGKMIETKNTSASSDFVQISVTGTVPENPGDGDYLCLCFYSNKDIDLGSSTESSFSATYKNIQLEIGTEVTTYQPHTWNLLNKWQYSATQTVNGITFTNVGDGSIIVNGVSTNGIYYNLQVLTSIPKRHKIIINDYNTNLYFFVDMRDSDNKLIGTIPPRTIYTLPDNLSKMQMLYYINKAGRVYNNEYSVPSLYDLTLMYGAGNEPTTVDQFYTDHPELKVSPLGFIGLKNLEINNKNIKRLRYVTTTRNLFDINTGLKLENDCKAIYSGNTVSITSLGATATPRFMFNKITVEIGKTYTVSANWEQTDNSKALGLFISNENSADHSAYGVIDKTTRSRTFTATSTDLYLKGYVDYNKQISTVTISNLQIEEGSTVTPYVPYGYLDLGITPSNSGYILNKYNNLSEELLEENIEKDTVNYHIPDKTNILLNKVEGNTKK